MHDVTNNSFLLPGIDNTFDIHRGQVVLDPPFEDWVLADCSAPQGKGEDTFLYWRQAVAGPTYEVWQVYLDDEIAVS
jgi:hypothetical protein